MLTRWLPLAAASTAGCVLLSIGPGCVERTEKIRVHADGSVMIELKYEGTEEELKGPDALPSRAAGWPVERTVKEEDDKVKHILTAAREFGPREPLPESYAPETDPDAALYLQFPTEVRVDRRTDGTYFYFRRVYKARPWAYVQHWHDLCIDEDVEKLGEKDVDELTVKQRTRIVEGFICAEGLKQAEFADRAARKSHPQAPPEDRLIARQALIAVYEDRSDLYEDITRLCQPLPEDERDDCFNRESNRMLEEGYTAFVEALRADAGWSAGRTAAFERAFERSRKRFDVTSALAGHVFEIDVWMPGEIVAYNALDPKLDHEDGMSRVRFQFDGKAVRDRDHELIVVSRLPNR